MDEGSRSTLRLEEEEVKVPVKNHLRGPHFSG